MKTTLLQQAQAVEFAKNLLKNKLSTRYYFYEEIEEIERHIDALTDVETVLRNREARHPHGKRSMKIESL